MVFVCVCVCENKKIVSTHRTTNTGNCTLARNAVASSPPPFENRSLLAHYLHREEPSGKKNAARMYKAANGD